MLTFFPLSSKAKPEAMRRTIQSLVRHITLDPKPEARTVQIEYLFLQLRHRATRLPSSCATPPARGRWGLSWRPQGDSNPCTHRERVMS